MRVLLVGGAGKVGSMVRPALEVEHDVVVFDARPVPGLEGRNLVGDVNRDEDVVRAVQDADVIVYMAIGTHCLIPSFDINLKGLYRTLRHGLEAGVRRFVYTSTLSVFDESFPVQPLHEGIEPVNLHPYGTSKRLGELTCEAAAALHPDATMVILRLILPVIRKEIEDCRRKNVLSMAHAIAPRDLDRLLLAAIACTQPGAHIVYASSDLEGTVISTTRATELLGWKPEGR